MTYRISRHATAVLVLVLIAGTAALWPLHGLVIENYRSRNPVYVRLVSPGETFSLGFMHSVEHCPVYDRLKIDADYAMVVVETGFASSRTGLPYAAFGDEVFHREGNGFRITNMHRNVPEIFQWVNHRYDNTLQFGTDPPMRLDSLAGDTLLHLHIQKFSALAWGWLKARSYWHHRSIEHG